MLRISRLADRRCLIKITDAHKLARVVLLEVGGHIRKAGSSPGFQSVPEDPCHPFGIHSHLPLFPALTCRANECRRFRGWILVASDSLLSQESTSRAYSFSPVRNDKGAFSGVISWARLLFLLISSGFRGPSRCCLRIPGWSALLLRRAGRER